MNFIFKATVTTDEIRARKRWIDSRIVPETRISAANLREALEQYREIVEKKHYITISDNAIKNKVRMDITTPDGEPKQIGYKITDQTHFDSNDKWATQYLDLWVTITDFE